MRTKAYILSLLLLALLGCAEEESELDVVIPEKLYIHFTTGATSCSEIRDPGEDGVNKDVPGPYTIQIRNMKLVWNSRHTLAINLVQLRFDAPEAGGYYSKGLDLQEVDFLFKAPPSADPEVDMNALLWVDKTLEPPLGEDTLAPPYELKTISDCVVAFGGIEMKDERQTVTIPAEFIVRAQKLYRENGELTGEEDAVNKYIPVQLIYDPN